MNQAQITTMIESHAAVLDENDFSRAEYDRKLRKSVSSPLTRQKIINQMVRQGYF